MSSRRVGDVGGCCVGRGLRVSIDSALDERQRKFTDVVSRKSFKNR